MKNYKLEIWNIKRLFDEYNNGNINLNPPYQRNPIWSTIAQNLLIETILKGMPLPSFFLQEKENGSYEMVDGQQRTRAIIKNYNSNKSNSNFMDFSLSIAIIDNEITIDEIREFYVRVNKTGKKLERPELNKAEFYKTKFLALSSKLASEPSFSDLGIFKDAAVKRMFDRDYIEELIVQLKNGNTDKKLTVDQVFKKDLTDEEVNKLDAEFHQILNLVNIINEKEPINKTRFIQKNDFYTLFGLLNKIKDDNEIEKFVNEIFTSLKVISKGIRPTNDDCEILQEYAMNCVSQSNSKNARNRRLEILEELILNNTDSANEKQDEVLNYLNKSESSLKKVGNYLVIV